MIQYDVGYPIMAAFPSAVNLNIGEENAEAMFQAREGEGELYGDCA